MYICINVRSIISVETAKSLTVYANLLVSVTYDLPRNRSRTASSWSRNQEKVCRNLLSLVSVLSVIIEAQRNPGFLSLTALQTLKEYSMELNGYVIRLHVKLFCRKFPNKLM